MLDRGQREKAAHQLNIMDIKTLKIGDRVTTKKPHACGSRIWTVTRTGADFKLKCEGCEHVVVLDYLKAEKIIKDSV